MTFQYRVAMAMLSGKIQGIEEHLEYLELKGWEPSEKTMARLIAFKELKQEIEEFNGRTEELLA